MKMDKTRKIFMVFLVFVIYNDITLIMACLGLINPIITIIGHLIEIPLWFKIFALKDNVDEGE